MEVRSSGLPSLRAVGALLGGLPKRAGAKCKRPAPFGARAVAGPKTAGALAARFLFGGEVRPHLPIVDRADFADAAALPADADRIEA
jgi:hypothetical protein